MLEQDGVERFLTPVRALPFPRCSQAAIERDLAPASPALARYLQLVYGSAGRALDKWRWSEKDVVHISRLPNLTREAACTTPLGHANESEPLRTPAFYALDCTSAWSRCFANTDLLWRFDAAESERVCRDEPTHHGGINEASTRNTSALSEHLGWVEVSHLQNYRHHEHNERRQLWMDLARGSGLWYWRGHTLTVHDLRNCDECDEATRSIRMYERAAAHDTLVIDRRVGDFGQIRPSRRAHCSAGHVIIPFYKVEIVGHGPAHCTESGASISSTTSESDQRTGQQQSPQQQQWPPPQHQHPNATCVGGAPCDGEASNTSTPRGVDSVCPNLPRVLSHRAQHGAHGSTEPAEGTECLWKAWRGRLRWGWPEDEPAEDKMTHVEAQAHRCDSRGGRRGDERCPGQCPACTHVRVQTLPDGARWRIGCDWTAPGLNPSSHGPFRDQLVHREER